MKRRSSPSPAKRGRVGEGALGGFRFSVVASAPFPQLMRERRADALCGELDFVARRQPSNHPLPAPPKAAKSNGSDRSRTPVAAKIALETAGAVGGTARLADTGRRLGRRHNMRLHRRHFRETQRRIAVEITLIDATFREGDLIAQRRTQGEADAALDLRADNVGIDRDPAIDRRHDSVRP